MTPDPTSPSSSISLLYIGDSPEQFAALKLSLTILPNYTLDSLPARDLNQASARLLSSPPDAIILEASDGQFDPDYQSIQSLQSAAPQRPLFVLKQLHAAHSAASIASLTPCINLTFDPANPLTLAPQIAAAIATSQCRIALDKAQQQIDTLKANHRLIAHDLNNAIGIIWVNLYSLKKACSAPPDSDISALIQSIERETRTIAAFASTIATLGQDQPQT